MTRNLRASAGGFSLCCVVCFALLIVAVAQSQQVVPQQTMPRIEGESFAGRKVTLPEDASGKVAVLVFGFTKGSSKTTGAWADKLAAEFSSQPGFELYQLPVLEDVPRLIRGMVVSSIKKGVAESKRDHFVPILQGEAQLKNAVTYQEADDAYIVLLDRGKIVWQVHSAAPDDVHYSALREHIAGLLK